MALTQDTSRRYSPSDVLTNEHPILAATTCYEGGAIGIVAASGYARPLLDTDVFAGFCEIGVANPGASGAKTVRVRAKGVIELAVTGVVITSVGAKVYASADDTFTLTATTAVAIGRVFRYISDGVAEVYFEAHALRGLVDGDL